MQFRSNVAPQRRNLLKAGLGVAWGLAMVSPLRAQLSSGTRPLTIVVPFPSGGGADMDVRTQADALASVLARPILVKNAPGGGGAIATQKVALEPSDGNTLLYLSASEAVVTPLIAPGALPGMAELMPIGLSGSSPVVYFTRPDHPITSMEQLIARAPVPGQIDLRHGRRQFVSVPRDGDVAG